MSGFKRERSGQVKRHDGPKPSRNTFTPMFEHFRDELDEHHDRRERAVKASRDITALSKKIIFSLQRVRQVETELPRDIVQEMDARLGEIARLLAAIAPETQGINRHRYAHSLRCMEELVEALTFAHYLRTQSLITMDELIAVTDELARRGAEDKTKISSSSDKDDGAAEETPTVRLTEEDYLYGVFDLSGEMMRFATTTTALTGKLASATSSADRPRTIVQDMQELGSFFQMLPRQKNKTWSGKMAVLQTSVAKVERLGYGMTVRGSERGQGWVPEEEEP